MFLSILKNLYNFLFKTIIPSKFFWLNTIKFWIEAVNLCPSVKSLFCVDPDPYLEYGSKLDPDPRHWTAPSTVPVGREVKVPEAVLNLLGSALGLELDLSRVLLQAMEPPVSGEQKLKN